VKGLDLLLQALSSIKSDFTLHIGGKGKLMEDYKVMANELGIVAKCIFHGFVPHDEAPAFMKQLHFFVSASRFETFGIAMVEAMTCGLPVLATDSGGPREFIQSENGVMVPHGNVEVLKKAILKMMENYHRYKPDQVRSTILNKFSEDVFLEKITKVYAELV